MKRKTTGDVFFNQVENTKSDSTGRLNSLPGKYKQAVLPTENNSLNSKFWNFILKIIKFLLVSFVSLGVAITCARVMEMAVELAIDVAPNSSTQVPKDLSTYTFNYPLDQIVVLNEADSQTAMISYYDENGVFQSITRSYNWVVNFDETQSIIKFICLETQEDCNSTNAFGVEINTSSTNITQLNLKKIRENSATWKLEERILLQD